MLAPENLKCFGLWFVPRVDMPRQGTGKSKEEQPMLMISWYCLEVSSKNGVKLKESSVLSHCISLSSGLQKEFKEDKEWPIICLLHGSVD